MMVVRMKEEKKKEAWIRKVKKDLLFLSNSISTYIKTRRKKKKKNKWQRLDAILIEKQKLNYCVLSL
jgi:hypothetical protein